LTEERRRELAKQAKSEVEDAKISIRSARKDANSEIKNVEDASEDVQKNAEMDVQQLTDAYVKKADDLYSAKEAEILKV
jgi:ribosome recycling factor